MEIQHKHKHKHSKDCINVLNELLLRSYFMFLNLCLTLFHYFPNSLLRTEGWVRVSAGGDVTDARKFNYALASDLFPFPLFACPLYVAANLYSILVRLLLLLYALSIISPRIYVLWRHHMLSAPSLSLSLLSHFQ